MGTSAITAAVARKERDIVDAFRRAGATAPDRALPLAAGVSQEGIGFRRLRERAVVREAAPGTFYLDEEVWSAVRRTRQRVTGVFFVLLILVLVVVLVAAGRLW